MFLFGNDLSGQIQDVVSGENACLAVAFWGNGAVEALGLDRKNVKIICDISMGGTNPKELQNLGAPNNPNLRHIDNFHAKVYLSDSGAVVTSANASNNGIGFGGKAGLKEAGYHTQETKNIREWFNESFQNMSKLIDDEALKICKDNWDRRKNAHDRTKPNAQRMAFVDALTQEPGRFGDITFILSAEEMDPADQGELFRLATERTGIEPEDAIEIEREPARQLRDFINVHRDENDRLDFYFRRPIAYYDQRGVACRNIRWTALQINQVPSPRGDRVSRDRFLEVWDLLLDEGQDLEMTATAVRDVLRR